MKKLKVLVLNKKERLYVSNKAIERILDVLKTKVEVDDLWLLTESGQGNLSDYANAKPREINYRFFEDYKTNNVLEILDKEKPDVLLCSNDYEFWSRSFVLGAKFRHIPTILLMQFGFEYAWERNDSIVRGRLLHLKGRWRFLFGKFLLLLRTYRKTGLSLYTILKNTIDDVFVTFSQFEPSGIYGCDLILVHNDRLLESLKKKNIKSKIIVTGDPQMDYTFHKITKLPKLTNNSKMKVVFLTTSMVEHGLWTQKMWEDTIVLTISEFQKKFNNQIDLVLKIHPSSEKKDDYVALLNKFGLDVPILQLEDLTDVLKDADLVISYGDTWALWEAFLLNKPILIINLFNYSTDMIPFVNGKIAYELRNIEDLAKTLSYIQNNKISIDQKENFINKYLYKFDGQAGERSATAILKLVNEFNESNQKNN